MRDRDNLASRVRAGVTSSRMRREGVVRRSHVEPCDVEILFGVRRRRHSTTVTCQLMNIALILTGQDSLRKYVAVVVAALEGG
jgi:hypothetical protein